MTLTLPNPLCDCDSNATCCDGDTYLTNPLHCTCNSSQECCPGDTYETNSNYCTNDGKCDNSRRDGCKQPSGGSEPLSDSTTHHRWKCLGINDGTDAADCQIPRVPAPQCKQDSNGDDIPYQCDFGTSEGQSRRTTVGGIEDKWECVNSNGDKRECHHTTTMTQRPNLNEQIINGECPTQAELIASENRGRGPWCKKGFTIANPRCVHGEIGWTCFGKNGGMNVYCTGSCHLR